MYQKKTIRIWILSIALASLMYAPPVHAADSTPSAQILRVSPVVLPIQLSPGKTSVYTIRVDNLTDTPLPVSAAVEGFDASDEEGGVRFDDAKDNQTASPLISWISLERGDMIIPARNSREVSFTVRVPTQVAVGGYYAVLFLTPLARRDVLDTQTIIPRIGVVILGTLGIIDENLPANKRAEIVSFTPDLQLAQRGPITLTTRVKNISLNHFTAKPNISINPLWGSKIKTQLAEKTVLPGKIRRWETTVFENAQPNIYRITLAVSVGSGNWIYAATTIVIFPWISAIIVLGIFLMLMYLIVKRKNISKAIKAFFKA